MNLVTAIFTMKTHIILLVAFFAILSSVATDKAKIVCYYGSWAVYRPGDGKFDVENIDPFRCTHIIYTFTGLSHDGSVKILDPWNDIDLGALKRFSGLKEKNPELKTIIAIGGWNEGSTVYSQVAADPTLRENLAKSALKVVQDYGFDGFDLDWEYPGQRGGSDKDKQNVLLLIKQLRETFDASGNKYLLTAAVGAGAHSVELSYELPAFVEHLDFINVMAYDFHGAFDKQTGHNAPLEASSREENKTLNIRYSIDNWIAKGVPVEKMVLGLATYGRSFTLLENNYGLGVPATAGTPGPYTREAGMLGYNEICTMLATGAWEEQWDEEQKVPYMYQENQWVSFDNEKSLELKVEFALSKKLAGVMIWSIETDDFQGSCGPRFPLLTLLNRLLGNDFEEPTTPASGTTQEATTKPTTETTTTESYPPTENPSTTTTTPNTTECKKEGWIRDEVDCSIFYYCQAIPDGYNKFRYQCGPGLYFNLKILACDYPYNVPECS